MAKRRYHQPLRNFNGDEKNLPGAFEGQYAGRDMRRAQEHQDGEMIHEDPTAIANLPQEVIYHEYPRTPYMTYDLNDTITGVDELMRENTKQTKHGKRQGEKYETVKSRPVTR